MVKRDTIAGIILLLFGVMGIVLSLSYSYAEEYTPGPGFYPFWLSVILIVLSLALLISARKSSSTSNPATEKAPKMFSRPKIIFTILGVLLLVAIFLEKLGFIIMVGFTVSIFAKIVKPDYTWKKSILFGLVSTLIIYNSFRYGLGILLPKGVLPL